jgi:hypothetical protein
MTNITPRVCGFGESHIFEIFEAYTDTYRNLGSYVLLTAKERVCAKTLSVQRFAFFCPFDHSLLMFEIPIEPKKWS